MAIHFVELAQHARAHIGAPVVQLFFELVFNDLALLFHHQYFLQAGGKFPGELCLQGPHHGHLVQADAHTPASGVVQPQVAERLAGVVEGLAAGHQAQAVLGALDHVVVEPVGADVGQRGVPLGVKQAGFLLQSGVGPAHVHAAGWHGEVSRELDAHAVGVHINRGAGFHNLLDGFHPRPDAGEAAHGKGVHAQVEHVLHAGRKKHRRAAGLEDVVALVRGGGAFGHVVVTRYRNHTAPRCGARHIGVFEDVGAAVHARALAVPNAKYAVVFVHARGCKPELLRAPQGGGGQLFVDAGLKHHMVFFQMRLCFLQGLVVVAQGRSTVAADKTRGVFAGSQVAHPLQHGQAHQRLHATHERRARTQRVFVVQADVGVRGLKMRRARWGVHGLKSPSKVSRRRGSQTPSVQGSRIRAAPSPAHLRPVRGPSPGHGGRRAR